MTANARPPHAGGGEERLEALYRDEMDDAALAGSHPSEDEWVALATGTASPATRERIVDHLVGCAECAAVYRGLAELRRESAAIDPASGEARAAPWWMSRPWLAVAAVALLVIGTAVTVRRIPAAPPRPSLASQAPPPASVAPAPRGVPPALEAWAAELVPPAVRMPATLALTLRGRGNDPTFVESVGRALDRYRAADYDAAAAALSPLAEARPDVPEIAFYAGLSHLFAGRPRDAGPWLERATPSETLGDDARWFAAVALERDGDHAAAEARLRDLCAHGNIRRADACNLVGVSPSR